ncbi:MAG: riboflavin synthase [Thermoleophilia bacterium]|nr:riboflavin synthase [Thermoleophilia bacterium]
MFTGIVRELGTVEALDSASGGARIRLAAPATAATAGVGDSVALNGVCLTVTEVEAGCLAFDAVPETLARTSLADLAAGDRVNVEPALRAGEQLGGHIVQGHVDGVGRVRELVVEGEGSRLTVEASPQLLRYCVEKGSIAVEGVSLTVAALSADAFEVALVPHTLDATTLGRLRPGDTVNLEADVLAKYVERALEGRPQPAG